MRFNNSGLSTRSNTVAGVTSNTVADVRSNTLAGVRSNTVAGVKSNTIAGVEPTADEWLDTLLDLNDQVSAAAAASTVPVVIGGYDYSHEDKGA